MIYFKIATIVVAALGLLIYTLLFDKKYFFGLLVAQIICTGFLSFYLFYYIGSYTSSENDILLNTSINKDGSGEYLLDIDVKWKMKPEIFGFNGKYDFLVVRYNPNMFKVLGGDKDYSETATGTAIVKLSEEYNYSAIKKNEKEIYFCIEDGEDISAKVNFKELESEGAVKVFFLHDYKIPLGLPVYWEKEESVEFK